MPKIIKGALANIVFPMVDSTDFASIESGITASDFNSAATKQWIGVDHGNSTAVATSTISKATLLVHSGIFQQTLNETETNHDMLVLRFTHPSCADQILIYECVDYDDSDLMSRLSDIGSDLLSYLTGMSGAISDVDSQLLLNASMISDAHSAAILGASHASDAHSMAQDIDSQLLLTASLVSDVDSQLLVTHSLVSDIDSQVNLLATSDYLSGVHSDLRSQISGITASVSASDISDIASAVWAADYSVLGAGASSFGSRFQVDSSRILVIQSSVSDVDSQLLVTHSLLSDVDSQVNLLATSDYLSQVHSDLTSQIGDIGTGTVTASDISDIVSAVWAADYSVLGAGPSSFGSKIIVNTSRISDIYSLAQDIDSQLLLNASMISDAHSAAILGASHASDAHSLAQDIDSQLLLNASAISDVDSALTLHDANISGMISDVDSQLLLNASMISDIDSQLTIETSRLSDIYSLLSDVDSQVLLNASMISDIDSQIDAGVTVGASSISDIESAVWAHSLTEPTAAVAAGPAAASGLAWLTTAARNKIITDSDSGAQFLRNDADDSNIASAAVTDDGSQFIRGEYT